MSTVCQHCGISALIQDSHHSQVQWVCTECGAVSAEGSFETDTSDATFLDPCQRVNLPQVIARHGPTKYIPKAKKSAKSRLHDLAAAYGLPRSMKDEAIDLFDDAYAHSAFRQVSEERKIILAGCCVYAVIRQHGWAIPLSFVSNYLKADTASMNKVFKSLLEALRLEISTPDVEELVQVYVRELQLTGWDEKNVVNVMQQILRVTKMVLLSTGVSYQPLLSAVCYIACRSVQQIPSQKLSFKKFCANSGAKYSDTSSRRVAEIIEVLIKLGKSVPWLENRQLNKQNIFTYVDTIIKFPHALSWKDESDVDGLKEPATNEMFLFTRPKKRAPQNDDSSQVLQAEPRSCPPEVANSTELSQEDIPESELSMYIRTSEEIEYIQKLQNEAGNQGVGE